jgi:hypothetical protein
MNETQRPIVYRIVRAVQEEEISRKEGLHQMQRQAGVPPGSAGILISVFNHMRRGVVYKRAKRTRYRLLLPAYSEGHRSGGG